MRFPETVKSTQTIMKVFLSFVESILLKENSLNENFHENGKRRESSKNNDYNAESNMTGRD